MNKNQNESEFLSYFPAILSFLVTEETKEDLALKLLQRNLSLIIHPAAIKKGFHIFYI